MATDQWKIRLVSQSDNQLLAKVLRDVLIEMNAPEEGTAYADSELNAIYDAYLQDNADYWMVKSLRDDD